VFAGRRRQQDSDEEESEEDEDDMMDLGEEDEGIDASFLARMNESDLKRCVSSVVNEMLGLIVDLIKNSRGYMLF
jgi:hypothetical protein